MTSTLLCCPFREQYQSFDDRSRYNRSTTSVLDCNFRDSVSIKDLVMKNTAPTSAEPQKCDSTTATDQNPSPPTRLPSINYSLPNLLCPPKLSPSSINVTSRAMMAPVSTLELPQSHVLYEYRPTQGVVPVSRMTAALTEQYDSVTTSSYINYALPKVVAMPGASAPAPSAVTANESHRQVSTYYTTTPLAPTSNSQQVSTAISYGASSAQTYCKNTQQHPSSYSQRWLTSPPAPILPNPLVYSPPAVLAKPNSYKGSLPSPVRTSSLTNSLDSSTSSNTSGSAASTGQHQISQSVLSSSPSSLRAATLEPRNEVSDSLPKKVKSKAGRKPLGDAKIRSYPCLAEGCTKVFGRKSHRERHMNGHAGTRPFKCLSPTCNSQFTRYDNMMQHYRRHHEKKADILSS